MKDAKYIEQQDWLAHKLVHDGRLNLICFPYAGGTSAIFMRWRLSLPDWVNICPIVFPGRESLLEKPMEKDFTTLANRIAKALLPQLRNLNFALYGHSMGAWFAHDLALRACQKGVSPRLLLVSGQRAPQFSYPFDPNSQIDDTTLLNFINSFGGLDAELLANHSWVTWMLKLMRSDLSLCETHPSADPNITLSCPLHLFAGISDPLIKLDTQLPWQLRTTETFSLSLHEGGHFFIRTHADTFLEKMKSVLTKILLIHKKDK